MSSLALFLLGSPRIECDGEPIEICRRKAMALIAYLAVTGQSHSRDALATLFWPELDQSRARAGLRRALASLKKALSEGCLDVDRETVGLNPDAEVWSDVTEFQDRLAECRTHDHSQDQVCPDCLPLLTEVATLYRGDFLAGFTLPDSPAFDEWQFFHAESLRNELGSALERLAHGHNDQGEYEQAIAYARHWLALDPLHESAHRCLMELYAESGQRAAALRQYGECERILQKELGVPPEEETTQLYQAIQERREKAMTDSQPERYRLEKVISDKGSFGDVWLATDTVLDRPVAVKCPKVAHDPAQRERFVTEARMLARLNHPNITQIHDALFDEREDRFYLVMEYVDGQNLAEILEGGIPLSLDVVFHIAKGVLRALSYAHGQGVVHRDVKPDNVMIADDVKLTDFGLANLKSILQEGTDFLAGTIGYLSPEQIEGRPTDGRTDLYSLGIMLFEMISGGHPPFDYANQIEMLNAHLHAAPPPISQYAPTIPTALEQAIVRLLAKDPEDRYPSADAVLEVLHSIPVGSKLSNLPIQPTPFVGREAVLAEIADRLQDPDCRLLTLVGPGGSGKTRLALETAAAQLDNYTHGVWFVSLAPLQSVDAIVPTVADALGFRFYEEGEPQQQLLDYLRQKSLLLIMDNYEHLLDGTDLVTEILKTAPDVKVLATSRARLNVGGEHRFQITGMDFPKLPPEAPADAALRQAQDAVQYSAVKLFLQGARRAQPGFEPTDENMRGVIDVCSVVEGMPLAIRLAAAWVEILTPAEIAAEISQGIDFLETDLRDVPERQSSMRAVFDHSWHLLAEREREVFQGLSVFRGGFTREAAQEVTGASLRELMALVNKSLLHRTPTGRYEVHELLRQYAVEKLETLGEADAARNAHGAYYVGFLHQREEDLKGRRQLEALDDIEADFENVRAAWSWALNQRNHAAIGRAMGSLGWFCEYRSRGERAELFHQARELLAPGPDDEPHPVWARMLVAEFYARPHEVDQAQVKRALAIAQQHGNRWLTAVCLRAIGMAAFIVGDYTEALSFHERSYAHYCDLDDRFNMAASLYQLAETCRLLTQPDKALEFARQSLDLSREIGDNYWAACSLANTGVIAFYTGNYTEAEGYLREANTIYREMGYRKGIASSNVVLSKLACIRGDFEEASALAEEALNIATDIGSKRIAESARYWLFVKIFEEGRYRHPDDRESIPAADIPTSIDQYKVKRLIGTGAAAGIYLARDSCSGRDVVLKVANLESLKQWDLLRMWRHAGKVQAKLAHPAIPEYYDCGETADHVYIVLEYIKGKSLDTILEEQERFLPETDVIEWAIQLCDVLAYLHNHSPEPIIHRDVKPGNVMIEPSGKVRLVDFGIAEPYRPGRVLPLIGTEGYTPPEQYFGYTDARSDVYALGVTLHHLLTRRDPRKEKVFSFCDAPPRSLNPTISEELEAVIMKAVEHHPEDRYQSAEEMKAALLACLGRGQ